MAKAKKPKTSEEARARVEYWEAKRLEAEKVLRELEEQERLEEEKRVNALKDKAIHSLMKTAGFDNLDAFIEEALPSITKLVEDWRANQPTNEASEEESVETPQEFNPSTAL